MKYFIDTEFIENGPRHPVHLISIGIVCEDGREFYREDSLCREDLADSWVAQNVLPNLKRGNFAATPFVIRQEIMEFVGSDPSPEFWGYYADYDWVVFAQLFGCMVDLPTGWPMFCRDIKQLAVDCGNPELPAQDSVEHNALNDARWNFVAWKFLNARPSIAESRLAMLTNALEDALGRAETAEKKLQQLKESMEAQ